MTTDRAAFLAERKLGIGGSDAASLFNIGWGCQRRLWYGKRSTPEDFPREETDAMALGQFLEPWFAEKYAKQTSRHLEIQMHVYSHPIHTELRVNVDRFVWKDYGDHGEGFGVLEIKSCGRAAFYKYKREGLPEDYILQLQWGMMVTGATWGSFAIGCRDDGNLMYWDHEADAKLHAEMLAAGPAFWATVENGPIPDALEPDDRRCQQCEFRVTCQGSALVELAPESDYTPDESLRPLVQEFIERRDLRKEASELFEETKAELECALGDRTMVSSGGAKIQFYEFTKKQYVVPEHKERPLRLYPAKGGK